jgi:hypothetical protein
LLREYRFVYPVIALVVLVAAVASAELLESLRRRHPAWRRRALALAGLAWALASLAAAPRLSADRVAMSDRGMHDPLYWKRLEGAKRSFTALSRRDDVCGVALVNLGWAFSAGYNTLHHDVPIFELREPEEIPAARPHANYLVTRRVDAPRLDDYSREHCWGRICLYRRPGGCQPAPGYDLNARIAEKGE